MLPGQMSPGQILHRQMSQGQLLPRQVLIDLNPYRVWTILIDNRCQDWWGPHLIGNF